MKPFRTLIVAACCIAGAASACAHDTWIMPITFNLPPGQPVAARMSAGDGLKTDAPPRRERLVSVELVDAVGRSTHTRWQAEDKHVDLAFPPPAAGVACMAVTTKDREIEIKPDVVDAYLAEIQPGAQVLQAWAGQRARGEPWKERYAKDAKTCIRTGSADAGWPRLQVLGQTLEIVPAQDPTRLRRGERLGVELRHNGKPLPDVALRLYAGQDAEKVVRTDAQGRASFELLRSGPHLIATTRLDLPDKPGGLWTSRFATMGFGVAE
jgi:uncharacterized GH25 family protein